jgi:CheY-like chemotaxis protein
MLRVLVCDTDPKALQDLAQEFQSVAQDWQVTGLAGNDEALAALAEPSFDVVVADVRLSAVDGKSLLGEVRKCRLAQVPHRDGAPDKRRGPCDQESDGNRGPGRRAFPTATRYVPMTEKQRETLAQVLKERITQHT